MGGVPTSTSPRRLIAYRSRQLDQLPWLVHGFSSRHGGFSAVYGGGALNLGFTKHDTRSSVERNREVFLTEIGAADKENVWPIITLRQVHSDLIHHLRKVPETHLVGDGLITNMPRLVMAVQTADCLPILLVDPKRKAIGAFHAGWRGALKRIVQKGVGEMRKEFGSDPQNLIAALGPGIHACCYQVGREVRDKFESQFAYAPELFREVKESNEVRKTYPLLFLSARPPGHGQWAARLFLDLVEANRRQLLEAGVPAKNIEASPMCTSCRVDRLFSHRAENGVTARMMGAVGIRP
jgi:purine-nucleoside/S-methyl-5'-thioadenosine phosphorylase / adenosine deaminase